MLPVCPEAARRLTRQKLVKATKKRFADKMNREIEEFRRALIFEANNCDWDTFEGKAGMLFDYLESIEVSEIRRMFSLILRITGAVLLLAGLALALVSSGSNPPMLRFEAVLIVSIAGGLIFEALFFVDFRVVTRFKASHRSRRRKRFVRNIENDFRSLLKDTGCMSA